jgi:hypothetical protein
MDASELAQKMLEYEHLHRDLQKLGREIQKAVLEREKTFVTGNVRATYSKGRRTYDYQAVEKVAPLDLVQHYTHPKVDWKAVCAELDYEAPVVKTAPPTVTIKVATDADAG